MKEQDGDGVICPRCGGKHSTIRFKRREGATMRRRHHCKNPKCLNRYWTREVIEERYLDLEQTAAVAERAIAAAGGAAG